MIIKGGSTSGADALAKHVGRLDTNERRNEVLDLRGVANEDLRGAFREMEAVAKGNPNCERSLYHASINTRADERLTDEQKLKAVDRLERELGLTGQPRAIVVHEKFDRREHIHVVWSRIDQDSLRVISDSHNFRKHEIVARELEREFGHERVQGAHIEREGKERPERAAGHREHQQSQRTGISPKKAREQITALWKAADSGQAFQQALNDKGWLLARGDRRDFVAVDRYGTVHSLARRIEGVKAAEVRAKLADIDPKLIASVSDAKAVQLARLSDRERDAQRQRELAAQGRLQAATRSPRSRKGPQANRGRAEISTARVAGQVAGGVLKGFGKALGSAASVFENLLGGGPAPPDPRLDRSQAKSREEGLPLDSGPPMAQRDLEERLRQAEGDKAKQRQQYLRDFDREVPDELQRDADLNRERGHEGGRERKRGNRSAGVGATPEMEPKPSLQRQNASGQEALAAFKEAARFLALPIAAAPRPGRRKKRSSGSRSLNAGALAADYLKLCRAPTRDIRRWIEEDRRTKKGQSEQLKTKTKGGNLVRTEDRQADTVARAVSLRAKSLHEMRGGLDAKGEERPLSRRLPSGSRSGFCGDGELRPVRSQGGAGLGGVASSLRVDIAAAFRAEHAALACFYAARLEAAKRGVSAAAIMAAIQALLNEQTVALRSLADRRSAAEKQQSEQASRPEIRRERGRGRYGHG